MTDVPLNHPITKWHDRSPLLAAAAVPLLLWIGVRVAEPDLSFVISAGIVVGGLVLGTAIGLLVARLTSGAERARALVRPLAVIAVVTAVLLEVSWFIFKDIIDKVDWPSAKLKILNTEPSS